MFNSDKDLDVDATYQLMSEDGSENEFHSPSNAGTEDVIEDLSFHDNEELFFHVPHSHPTTPNEDRIQTRARPHIPRPRSPTRPHVLSEDSVFTWPPRHLSSEDYTHLEAAEVVHHAVHVTLDVLQCVVKLVEVNDRRGQDVVLHHVYLVT